MLQRFTVVTPEYEVYSATEIDPPEYGADVIEVEAESSREAKLFAVRLWRKQHGRTYIRWYRDECPFTGLKVFKWSEDDSL